MTKSGLNRTLVILAAIVVIVLAAVGYHHWEKNRWSAELEAARETSADLQALAERRSGRLALSEAEAVAHAFAAGLRPEVLSRNDESLSRSITALLKRPEVLFAHVFAPDGGVMATSDRKLEMTGEAGNLASWALEVDEVSTRGVEGRGTEVALVIVADGRREAVLWMGYDTDAVLRDVPGEGR